MIAFEGSLDANVLLRLLLNDIPSQHSAAEALLNKAKGQLAVADTAIIEVVFVLERHYEFPRPAIAEALEGLTSLTALNCNCSLVEKAMPVFVKNSSLSFEDCCLAVYAELNNARPLWTFDRKMANQAPGVRLLT